MEFNDTEYKMFFGYKVFSNGLILDSNNLPPDTKIIGGYRRSTLKIGFKEYLIFNRKLVAKFYLRKPINRNLNKTYKLININGDKLNDSVSNLKWVVVPYKIIGYDNDTLETIYVFNSVSSAKNSGLNVNKIKECIKGVRPSYEGLRWIKQAASTEKEQHTNNRSRKIKSTNPDTLEVKIYNNIYAASIEGFAASHICNCCKKNTNIAKYKHKGLIWEYV